MVMAISGVLATAISGLTANARRAQVAADNIVNVNTPGFAAARVLTTSIVAGGEGGGVLARVVEGTGGVDLGREFVDLIGAQVAYDANAQVIRAGEDLARRIVDIIV
jgi:flagellar basal-body rod protein FlgC